MWWLWLLIGFFSPIILLIIIIFIYALFIAKKYGDLQSCCNNCEEIECNLCPLRLLCYRGPSDSKLFDEFEIIKEDSKNWDIFDKEIFDLIEKRLNEVVE